MKIELKKQTELKKKKTSLIPNRGIPLHIALLKTKPGFPKEHSARINALEWGADQRRVEVSADQVLEHRGGPFEGSASSTLVEIDPYWLWYTKGCGTPFAWQPPGDGGGVIVH